MVNVGSSPTLSRTPFINMEATPRERFQKETFPFLKKLCTRALRLTRQTENAEDLVSEVYSRAWKSYAQFTPGTNMRAWLYRILTNTFINHYRHKQRQPAMVNLDQSTETESGEGTSLYDKLADTAARPDEVLA